MSAQLATAQAKLRLDVNFGDLVNPAPGLVELPALRPGYPPVRILGYPLATVLAEKLVTAIHLGPANTRVRDFVDVVGPVVEAADRGREAALLRGGRQGTATQGFGRGGPVRPRRPVPGVVRGAGGSTADVRRRVLAKQVSPVLI